MPCPFPLKAVNRAVPPALFNAATISRVADNGDIPVRGPGKWNTRVGITMKGPIEIRC